MLGAVALNKTASESDGYLDRLLKYIPAEIITLYLGASNVVPHSSGYHLVNGLMTKDPAGPTQEVIGLWVVAGLTAVITPVYLYFSTKEPGKLTLWSQIVISSLAFPVWVFAIGGPFERTSPEWYAENRWIAAIVICFGTFLAGMYKPPSDEELRSREAKRSPAAAKERPIEKFTVQSHVAAAIPVVVAVTEDSSEAQPNQADISALMRGDNSGE